MQEVVETAQYLRGEHPTTTLGHDGGMPWRARRTLEAGMFVSYARPFVRTRGGGLPTLNESRDLTPGQRAAHGQMIKLRNAVYAHTDQTPLRQILEFADDATLAVWASDGGDLSEQWHPPTRELLSDLVGLAAANLASFDAEVAQLRRRISELRSALWRDRAPSRPAPQP
jgi:hypothetical protein